MRTACLLVCNCVGVRSYAKSYMVTVSAPPFSIHKSYSSEILLYPSETKEWRSHSQPRHERIFYASFFCWIEFERNERARKSDN